MKEEDNTPASTKKRKMEATMIDPQYLSGFVDGEGSFVVSVYPRSRCPSGLEVLPSFSVSQSERRGAILYLIKGYFGCGTVRPSGDGTLKFETRSVGDILEKVVPHFTQYPLISGKRKDFEILTAVCRMMTKGLHRSTEGLKSILEIISEMNPSGSRKYSKEFLFTKMKI